MQPTGITARKGVTVLHLVSASAAYSSTFVLREVRQLRHLGLETVIGQLRPVFGDMSTTGFEELAAIVVKPRWLSLELIAGIVYYARKQPRRLWRYLVLIVRSGRQVNNAIKMLYVLLASMTLAYKSRGSQIGHARAHFLHTEALAAYFVSGFLHVPYSITVHTISVHYPPTVIREVVGGASFVVADTHQVYEFLQVLGGPCGRLRLIRNGVPLDELTFRDGRVASDPPIVLAAGYLCPKKGFDVLLKACSILSQRGVRFRCVLVGDGKERKNLAKLRNELGLENEVEMPGNLCIDDLRNWYYHATIFVMPSVALSDASTDGLPTVVIEALACGTPVIGTNTAAIPEVVLDGRTGLLVPAGAPDAIADRIQLLLSQDRLRRSLAHEGRGLIEQEFDLRRNSESLAGLILSHATIPQPCSHRSNELPSVAEIS